MTIKPNTMINKGNLKFSIPTSISNQQPIFILEFLINETPSVSINLNAHLHANLNSINKDTFFRFNEDGVCTITKKFHDNYFIDAELILKPNFGKSPDDNYCKMSINYGKGESELFYLKGTFNLNDFSN